MAQLSVVTWLWQEGFRDYGPQHVNSLARMIRARLRLPHRFVCVADDPSGFDAGVEYFPTPATALAVGRLRNPEGPRFPSCYRRLWMFSETARALGELLLLLDIDLLATNELAPLIDQPHDFVGWRPRMKWGNQARIGGGIYLLKAGTRTHVWNRFKGAESILEARRAGYRGSDQAWLSYCLAATEASWNDRAGIYSIRDLRNGRDPLPADARLVQFNGPQKPWNSPLPWVKDHWR
jgi:hypothetical protein